MTSDSAITGNECLCFWISSDNRGNKSLQRLDVCDASETVTQLGDPSCRIASAPTTPVCDVIGHGHCKLEGKYISVFLFNLDVSNYVILITDCILLWR